MSDNFYTTKTAALKATKADIRNLDAKQIKLNGKPIIGEFKDLRGNNATPYDVWPNGVQDDGKGNIVVYPMGYNKISLDDITDEQYEKICSSTKIIDNVCYDNDDNIICYFETSSIKNTMGERISFLKDTAIDFSSDLSSLENGSDFFKDWAPRDTNGNLKDKNFTFDSLKISSNMFDNSHFNSLKIYAPILNESFGMFRSMSAEKVFELNAPDLETSSAMCEYVSCEDFFGKMNNIKNAQNTFIGCNIKNFKPDLSGLTSMDHMFNTCEIENFNADISNVTSAVQAFEECTITNFNSNLSMLSDASYMFIGCSSLESFTADLPSLQNGNSMFEECNITSFSSDLSSLTNGESMFSYCGFLTSFSSDLSRLTEGTNMFRNCKLDAHSVANIIHTLPTHETGGEITIGIGCNNTAEDQLLFAQECHCETWQELLDEFSAKNWTVGFQYRGRPTESTTYNMRRGETLPVYTKLEEVIMPTDEKEYKPHYAYTSADGSKFYNIRYFHSTNGSTDGYDVFSSLEEAISTYNVTPKN